ncbi:6292_t:CDS:2 [Diversispora eburnea]|uniref:6292_t:CDS:1 n=1 Tax=Diversispora eburnea TaxID=1213867 RepID=A0A9N8V1M9_9GLOM|nr:6292_t:CDS:2 [Diversispora eburnea]
MATTFSGITNIFWVSGVSSHSINSIHDNSESKSISQIENEVNATICEVHNDVDVDIIEFELSHIKDKKRDKIFEAIHNIFSVEIIDNEFFIKFDGGIKTEIHRKLENSFNHQLPTWWTEINTVCVVNGNQYRPDVDGKPRLDQRFSPIINSCPPPLLWIEVIYDRPIDRDNAINKITRIQPHCPNTEFVIIVLPIIGLDFPF